MCLRRLLIVSCLITTIWVLVGMLIWHLWSIHLHMLYHLKFGVHASLQIIVADNISKKCNMVAVVLLVFTVF